MFTIGSQYGPLRSSTTSPLGQPPIQRLPNRGRIQGSTLPAKPSSVLTLVIPRVGSLLRSFPLFHTRFIISGVRKLTLSLCEHLKDKLQTELHNSWIVRSARTQEVVIR